MTQYYKYPRTPHLPWSPGGTKDDIRTLDTAKFVGRQVVVSEKMDGENTTMYTNHIHARSIDSRHHPSRDWVKALHAQMGYQIPTGWRICGENLFAQHSIVYQELASYFLAFAVFDEHNRCLSWAESLQWFELLGLKHPKILYQGIWDENAIRSLKVNCKTQEGYVVRTADAFDYDEFKLNLAKWVRTDHVQTDTHWMHAALVANKLKEQG